jgi:hypothetical protein
MLWAMRTRRRALRTTDEQQRLSRRRVTLAPGRASGVDVLATVGNRAISRLIQDDPNGLPPALRGRLEGMSGISLSDVCVNRGSSEPARMDAFAFTQGSDIHLGPGQEQHLAHEAWHVVQQKQGRVAATGNVDGQPLNHSPALEAEADAVGAGARGRSTARASSLQSVSTPSASPVQLKCKLCGAKSHNENKCPKNPDAGREEKKGGRGLNKAGKKEKELFELILPKLDPTGMYGAGAKSLVGGYKGKPNGLKDNSIRIDRQGEGNVQFQIGDDSYACAEFEQEDEPEKVIAALRKSLESGKNEAA